MLVFPSVLSAILLQCSGLLDEALDGGGDFRVG
jgi:hypothetical protein